MALQEWTTIHLKITKELRRHTNYLLKTDATRMNRSPVSLSAYVRGLLEREIKIREGNKAVKREIDDLLDSM